ncbi:uncharacterized protein PFL1_00682 [Pseudozyma flocculosa PF-1]|uniref:Uncharacterized protein n=1 Tax=Pseudozyma flocculosa TaxID=84751 RepID=A0A5C3F4L8_9BASI|nr:uncharacterized protein PFL1_00682 [Pseudozyma flocculosa PF-1]EPQ31347.1 hypothetical protein PFL1_00682 [Pseudozyma flocculosa PF-1]SPO38875.1 uncharacterized protein PSFLO_04354 [Pseudozyma flocculosa]
MSQPYAAHSQANAAAAASASASAAASTAASNTALLKKERHYAALAGQLEALSSSMLATRDTIIIASEQAHYIRQLGISQAATFMATLDSVTRQEDEQDEHRRQHDAQSGQ